MVHDDVRRWAQTSEQWVELCARFLEANKEFRSATVAAKAGVPGARAAAARWAERVRETEAACLYFIKHRQPPSRDER
jgi:hypothetical protein